MNDNVVKPIAPYLGGKSKLAKTICSIIDNTPHKTYAEPFIGMGGILFRRENPVKAEVINDYNREVFTLFRVLQRHYDEFIKQFEYINHSRNHFKYIKNLNPNHLTDIERASRFYFLLRASFGAMASTL